MTGISLPEIKLRQKLVKEIRDGMDGIGTRLMQIRDESLWRGDFDSFDEFVKETFAFTARRANQMIEHVKVVETLGTIGSSSGTSPIKTVVPNERQTRELAKVPPAQQVEIWTEVIETSAKQGKKPTSSFVKATVEKRTKHSGTNGSRKSNPPEKPQHEKLQCPMCDGCGSVTLNAEIPSSLDTVEFRQAWAMWSDYRKREKRNSLKPTTIKLQMKELESLGAKQAIATIRNSMKQGWTGLFQEKANGSLKPTRNVQGRRFIPEGKR